MCIIQCKDEENLTKTTDIVCWTNPDQKTTNTTIVENLSPYTFCFCCVAFTNIQ